MTKEQEARIKLLKDFTKMDFSNPMGWTGYYDTELKELSEAIETVLSMLKEKDAELEKKEKMINKMIDEIMTHYQVKTMRKMCCPACKIGERACTYSGIHRNCIKQYFENKVKE